MSDKRFPPVMLATCLLPWTDTNELDERLFRAHVRELRRSLTEHLYLFGTAGEGYAVSDRQFERIVRLFHSEMPAPAEPMVGIISLSLSTIIERIALSRDLGVRAFQLSLPSWGELNDREVDAFFRETCGRFPDCRFLHYNLRRAKRRLTGTDYARLAAEHENLVAVKMGGEDQMAFADILTRAPALQCFFTEFGFGAMRERHECGYLVALGMGNFEKARQLFHGRGPALTGLIDEFRAVHRALKAATGLEARIDGAYDKLYARLQDPRFPLRLLPPYEGSGEAVFAAFCAGLPQNWRGSATAQTARMPK